MNIVLFEPEIPNNTGNIGRLSLASGSTLHLVKPFGFDISDKRVKRAGLDYWKHLDLIIYDDIEHYFAVNKGCEMAFLSSHGAQRYTKIPYSEDIHLIFGKESNGLGDQIRSKYGMQLYKIPIMSEHIRSMNIANAVSIVVYEGIRQLTAT